MFSCFNPPSQNWFISRVPNWMRETLTWNVQTARRRAVLKRLREKEQKDWNITHQRKNESYFSSLFILTCFRLSVSTDDRKSGRVTSGDWWALDPSSHWPSAWNSLKMHGFAYVVYGLRDSIAIFFNLILGHLREAQSLTVKGTRSPTFFCISSYFHVIILRVERLNFFRTLKRHSFKCMNLWSSTTVCKMWGECKM